MKHTKVFEFALCRGPGVLDFRERIEVTDKEEEKNDCCVVCKLRVDDRCEAN